MFDRFLDAVREHDEQKEDDCLRAMGAMYDLARVERNLPKRRPTRRRPV